MSFSSAKMLAPTNEKCSDPDPALRLHVVCLDMGKGSSASTPHEWAKNVRPGSKVMFSEDVDARRITGWVAIPKRELELRHGKEEDTIPLQG